jgi:hypothetical protein
MAFDAGAPSCWPLIATCGTLPVQTFPSPRNIFGRIIHALSRQRFVRRGHIIPPDNHSARPQFLPVRPKLAAVLPVLDWAFFSMLAIFRLTHSQGLLSLRWFWSVTVRDDYSLPVTLQYTNGLTQVLRSTVASTGSKPSASFLHGPTQLM